MGQGTNFVFPVSAPSLFAKLTEATGTVKFARGLCGPIAYHPGALSG